ncbi:beta-N-acetylhexosaminidase [Myxococcota bacterium]|nr:beta-N-acetylhexosaminidase [Myxococcota bacterium]
MESHAGDWVVPDRLRVALVGGIPGRVERALLRWRDRVLEQTGSAPEVFITQGKSPADLTVRIDSPGPAYPRLGIDESYRLSVGHEAVVIHAGTTYGALHALQTLRQLVQSCGQGLCVPRLEVRDAPRFAWRGLMIDVVRHWIGPEAIERQLDAMAAVKMNVLHLHLSDDQGFRVESHRFPELHRKGSDGRYFRQAQIRDLVEYAADRGIRVVPEFDLPGHSRSWQIAYPELASRPSANDRLYAAAGLFSDPIDPTKASVYVFLKRLMAELTSLFPDEYFHMGGDEVDPSAWEDNDAIVQFMADEKIADFQQLQAYFIGRYAEILGELGKVPVGWNDILNKALPSHVVLQVWNTTELPRSASEHPIVVSMNYYLDHMRSAEFHYRNDPLALTLGDSGSEVVAERVLGVEAASWAELKDESNVDLVIWPRTIAIAESMWSPRETIEEVSSGDLYRRLAVESTRLERSGLRHRIQQRDALLLLVGPEGLPALETLATAVEPAPFYSFRDWQVLGRMALPWLFDEPPDEPTPLQPFTSALAYESLEATRLRQWVDDELTQPEDPPRSEALRRAFQRWSDNHAIVSPIIEKHTDLLDAGVLELSEGVRELADAGLELLAARRRREPLPRHRLDAIEDTVERYASRPFEYTRDYLQYSLFQMFGSRVLRQHRIAIQPAVESLLDDARGF